MKTKIGVEWAVHPTTPAEYAPDLGALTITARAPGFNLQDYFTPDEARALARALLRVADQSEMRQLEEAP